MIAIVRHSLTAPSNVCKLVTMTCPCSTCSQKHLVSTDGISSKATPSDVCKLVTMICPCSNCLQNCFVSPDGIGLKVDEHQLPPTPYLLFKVLRKLLPQRSSGICLCGDADLSLKSKEKKVICMSICVCVCAAVHFSTHDKMLISLHKASHPLCSKDQGKQYLCRKLSICSCQFTAMCWAANWKMISAIEHHTQGYQNALLHDRISAAVCHN